MNFVISNDARPRLKWTPQLHQHFVDAVNRVGGVDKATPKSLMRVMDINGLTLYHLKSHLQKYRLGRNQQLHNYKKHESEHGDKPSGRNGAKQHNNENCEIEKALQKQKEVEKKIHEQIEVQRHLQLRTEAHGKYLQLVLRKAQETLSQTNGVEEVKAQLSELASMVDSRSPSCSSSVLTHSEAEDMFNYKRAKTTIECPSSETSWGREVNSGLMEEQLMEKIDLNYDFEYVVPKGIDLNRSVTEKINGEFV